MPKTTIEDTKPRKATEGREVESGDTIRGLWGWGSAGVGEQQQVKGAIASVSSGKNAAEVT